MRRLCLSILFAATATIAAAQTRGHSHEADSIIMARVDSIYASISRDDALLVDDRDKRNFEDDHYFMRAALCGWRQLSALTRIFGRDVIDYYLADGAVEDFYSMNELFHGYNGARTRYLASNKNRDGSYLLYGAIQRLTSNFSQLADRASFSGVRWSDRFKLRDTRVISIDDMRVVDSLHRYPAEYAYLYDTDMHMSRIVFFTEDYPKEIEKARQLLDEKRAAVGANHPGCALTLSEIAYLYGETGDYAQAIETQRQALDIYRATGCPTAVRLAARQLSYLCYQQRRATYDYKAATYTDLVERQQWARQEIDSLAPLLGPDSPEMDMARHEMEKWGKLRQQYAKDKAWQHIDSVYNSFSYEDKAQLRTALKIEEQCYTYEFNHCFLRAALYECRLLNILRSTFGQAATDTAITYQRRDSRYNSGSSSLAGQLNSAMNRIVADYSYMDTRIVEAMGKKAKGQYAGDTLKQFSIVEALPLTVAFSYPQKYDSLSAKDDDLANLIRQDKNDAMPYAEQLLNEKARTIGKRHPCYALTLSDLALLTMQSARKLNRQDPQRDSLYERAIELQTQAIKLYRKAKLPAAERMSVQFLSHILYKWSSNNSDWLQTTDDSLRSVYEQRKIRELSYTEKTLGDTANEVLAARSELKALQGYNEALIYNRHERGNDKVFAEAVAFYRQGDYKKALNRLESLQQERFSHLPNRANYTKQWTAACHLQQGDTAQAAAADPYYLLPPIDRTQTLEIDYLLRYDNDYRNILKMAADTLGTATPEMARMLLQIFEAYRDKAQYADAADVLSRAKTLCRSLVGDDNQLYAGILTNLADLYTRISYHQEAVLTLEESAALTARLQGRHSRAYAMIAESIVKGSTAMEDKRRVARWLQERLDTDTALTANGRQALMNDYLTNAAHLPGEILNDTAIQQRAADYAQLLADRLLHIAYSKRPPLSDTLTLDKMRDYYSGLYEAVKVYQPMAQCYKNMGRTDVLKEIENQWSTWMNDSVGWSTDTPWKARNYEYNWDSYNALGRLTFCYMGLSFVFRYCGNCELAAEAARRAAETQYHRQYNMRLLDSERAAVYDVMLYVANVCRALNLNELKKYDEARDVLAKAQRLREELEGGRKRMYYNVERFLIGMLNNSGRHDEAADHLKDWWNYLSDATLRQLVVLNGPQRELLWNQQKKHFESTTPYHAVLTGSSQTWGLLYDNALLCKGLLLNTEMEIERAISRYADREQAESYRQLKQNQLLLMSELQKPKQHRTIDTDSLQSSIRAQSYALMNTLQGDRSNDLVRQLRTSWTGVQKHLGKKDVAVEFIAVPMKTDSVVYAALTLRPGYVQPRLTMLCTLQQLKDMPAADYYGSSRLYDLLWKPLESELHDVVNIYFAPIGKLHQIGIEYLPGMERYNTFRLSSTRELTTATAGRKAKIDAALYGGLNFELSDDERDALTARHDNAGKSSYRDVPDLNRLRELRGAVEEMPVLEGSLHEVEDIDSLMRSRRISVTTAIGNDGTEEDFKALSGQHKSLIHISTHGFYQPEEPQQDDDSDDLLSMMGGGRQAQTHEDNSLSRSGLLMTGAADFIFGRVDNLSTDDGILTAREISRLDLSGLDLVVLSACETGLGDISGEGVFGLQRGFKKAGAQTLLVSLWKVDDEATQLLMTEFYRGLLSGKTKRQAFIDAQRYLRQARGGRFNRYECWAAFVMID